MTSFEKSDIQKDPLLAADGGSQIPMIPADDPFRVLDELMAVVEALCRSWPSRPPLRQRWKNAPVTRVQAGAAAQVETRLGWQWTRDGTVRFPGLTHGIPGRRAREDVKNLGKNAPSRATPFPISHSVTALARWVWSIWNGARRQRVHSGST